MALFYKASAPVLGFVEQFLVAHSLIHSGMSSKVSVGVVQALQR
jgi:hypothetical protein